MSEILVILETKYHPILISKIGAKNYGTGFRNTYFVLVFGLFAFIFGWFGWFLDGLAGFWLVSNFSNNRFYCKCVDEHPNIY